MGTSFAAASVALSHTFRVVLIRAANMASVLRASLVHDSPYRGVNYVRHLGFSRICFGIFFSDSYLKYERDLFTPRPLCRAGGNLFAATIFHITSVVEAQAANMANVLRVAQTHIALRKSRYNNLMSSITVT